ncbi:MAG: hypothetical protein RTU92_09030, partial [Candidatus Thorarchaeota archaeon]
MVELFNKYLSQIRKKLKRQSVPKEFIDEFLVNMGDQLYSMLEELESREPELDRSDATVSVLSSCEPVDIVVTRVVEQYHSKAAVPKIDSDESLEHMKFLIPLESRLVSFTKSINNRISQIHQGWKKRTSHQESVVVTSFLYAILWFGCIGLISLIGFFISPINIVTTFPDNLSYLVVGEITDGFWNNPSVTGIEVTPILPVIQSILIVILTIYLVGNIGWKYPTKYSLVVTGIFSLILSLIMVFLAQSSRLLPIVNSVSYGSAWTSFTPDWYFGTGITILDYAVYFVVLVYMSLIPNIIFPFLGIVLLSGILKSIKTREFKKPLVFSSGRAVAKLIIAMLCISAAFFLPIHHVGFHDNKEIPIPDSSVPLIYKFDLNWYDTYQSINGSQDHTTLLSQFGNLEFDLFAIYNLTNLQNLPSIDVTGSLNVLYDSEESTSSLQSFGLLGLLYLPNNGDSGGWENLVGDEINSSYPFNDFAPSANVTDNTLMWIVNGEETNVSVNTIIYSANSNNSEYIFHFDAVHGWLMKAELKLDAVSWTQELELRTLTI